VGGRRAGGDDKVGFAYVYKLGSLLVHLDGVLGFSLAEAGVLNRLAIIQLCGNFHSAVLTYLYLIVISPPHLCWTFLFDSLPSYCPVTDHG